MNFKSLFLPVGLLVALILAVLLPSPGVWMSGQGMVTVFIVIIFLLSGWHLNLKSAGIDRKLGMAFAMSIVVSLLIGPFVGLAVANALGLGMAFGVGLIVMSSVPVTLSSASVITEVSGGNGPWAVLMTIGLNIAGIFTVPFMLKFCIDGADDIDISAGKLLLKLLLLVLAPFVAGYLLRRMSRLGTNVLLSYTPSLCVILTVYVAFSVSSGSLSGTAYSQYPLLICAVLLVHMILMLIAWGGGAALKLEKPESKALMFVSSEKTLPIALSVISIIGIESGAALIPCLLFHFAQLIFDSSFAVYLAKRSQI